MKIESFPIVILCGGKSSRMQRDKSLIPFAGYKSLTQYQYTRLKKEFENVLISSKNNKFDFIDDNSPTLIKDDYEEIFSPLVAIKSILESLNSKKVFILTVDTPFVSINSIKVLIENSNDFDVVIAKTTDKIHNLCGVFSKDLLQNIDNMLKIDNHKIWNLIKNTNYKIIEFENEEEFINLNTLSEYEKALKLL